MKKIVKKILLVLVVLAVVLSALSRCGSSPRQAGNSNSVPASTSSSAAPIVTPSPTVEPLVEQTAFDISFMLPQSVAQTKTVSDDSLTVIYYPSINDPGHTRSMFTISLFDPEIPPAEEWTDVLFELIVSGMLGDQGTLIEQGFRNFPASDSLSVRYLKIKRILDDEELFIESYYIGHLAISAVYTVEYGNPATDIWEDLLDSVKLIDAPAETPSPDLLRPEFKEAMDSYEAFFDEYVAFMKKYNQASGANAAALLSDFADYMTQYTETMQKMNDLGQSDLSAPELAYYTEVSARVLKKLASVAQ